MNVTVKSSSLGNLATPALRRELAPSFNASSKTASMAIHDFSISGAYVPPQIVEQAKRFIEVNREVLLLYWNTEIGTKEMINRLKVPT